MEANTRYPIKFSKYASHNVIAKVISQNALVKANKLKVLDIGCSTGGLGDLIKGANVEYTGVEPFENDFNSAIAKGYAVYNYSAEEVFEKIQQSFDCVVYADVLEHLVDPKKVLRDSRGLLNKKGIVIVSIPNVGHWSVRLSLLLGRWNYTNRGILDRTHLRFFTKKTFSELVRNSGYQPLAKFYTPVPLETILPLRNNLAWRLIDLINYLPSKIYPSLFAFQFIYVIQESNYLI